MSVPIGFGVHRSGNPTAVHAGDFVLFGAVRGTKGGVVVEGVSAQAEAAFDHLEQVLGQSGTTLASLVRVGIFFRDLQGDRPAFDEVWRARMNQSSTCARYAVEVSDLGAPDDDSRFLLEAIAHLPAATQTN